VKHRSPYTTRRLEEIRSEPWRPDPAEALQQDFPRSFLVRRLRGQTRAMISALHGWREPKVWHFPLGIAVIDHSLSDALHLADRLLRRIRA
jgi:hypothetical protein